MPDLSRHHIFDDIGYQIYDKSRGTISRIGIVLSLHQLMLPWRGAGSRLHGSINDNAHLRFCLSRCRAPYQSSEQAARNFASRRS